MLHTHGKRHGFTLVELAIVVVIVGVLAAFAVPKFMTSVERSRAAEAFKRLTGVQTAQERYHALHGTYAHTVRLLDIDIPELEFFETTDIEPSDAKTLESTWSMTFTRKGAAERIGAYTVVFNEAGFDRKRSTISDRPEINPMEPNAE